MYGFSLYVLAKAIQEDRLRQADQIRRAEIVGTDRFESTGRLLAWPSQDLAGTGNEAGEVPKAS